MKKPCFESVLWVASWLLFGLLVWFMLEAGAKACNVHGCGNFGRSCGVHVVRQQLVIPQLPAQIHISNYHPQGLIQQGSTAFGYGGYQFQPSNPDRIAEYYAKMSQQAADGLQRAQSAQSQYNCSLEALQAFYEALRACYAGGQSGGGSNGGASVLGNVCGACHSPSNAAAKGDGLVLDPQQPMSHETALRALKAVSEGTMPKNGSLTPEQAKSLMAELLLLSIGGDP